MLERGARSGCQRGRTDPAPDAQGASVSLQSGAEPKKVVNPDVIINNLIVHKQFRADQSASVPNFKAFRSNARRAPSFLTVVPESEFTQVQITQRNHRCERDTEARARQQREACNGQHTGAAGASGRGDRRGGRLQSNQTCATTLDADDEMIAMSSRSRTKLGRGRERQTQAQEQLMDRSKQGELSGGTNETPGTAAAAHAVTSERLDRPALPRRKLTARKRGRAAMLVD